MSSLDQLLALHAANRGDGDAAIERQLVELRARLFERRPQGSSPARVAPPTPVGFGLPETSGAELDIGKLRAAMSSHGALHVRGLLDAARVERMRWVIDSSIEAQGTARACAPAPFDSPWFDPSATVIDGQASRDFVWLSGAALAVDSPRGLYQLLEMYYQLGIDRLITDYFGERPALSTEKTTFRRVLPGPEEPGWHQDGRFLGGDDLRSLNVWIALTDCDGDVPGLELLPTRLHRILPTGTEGAKFDWCVSPLYVEQEYPRACIKPAFKAGDALLFDHLLLHRTWRHPAMKGPRYAIESWFFAPSAYPTAQTGLCV